jgi:hypothetical protein
MHTPTLSLVDVQDVLTRTLSAVTAPIDVDQLGDPAQYHLQEGGARISVLEPLTSFVYALVMADTQTLLPVLAAVEIPRGLASLLYLFSFKSQESMLSLFRLFLGLFHLPDHAPLLLELLGKYLVHFDLHGVSVLEVLSSLGQRTIFSR